MNVSYLHDVLLRVQPSLLVQHHSAQGHIIRTGAITQQSPQVWNSHNGETHPSILNIYTFTSSVHTVSHGQSVLFFFASVQSQLVFVLLFQQHCEHISSKMIIILFVFDSSRVFKKQ